MDNGWIKIHRKITEWEWYKDDKTFKLFIHLLLLANHETRRWQGNEVKQGQLITGRFSLSEATGISEQSIRTSLNRLKSTNEITIKSTSEFSIITIVKWEDYQGKPEKLTSKSTSNLTNNQPATNHKQELKNYKKIKNNTYTRDFEDFWLIYPKKTGKVKASDYWKELDDSDKKNIMEDIPKRLLDRKWIGGFIKDPERYIRSRQWEDEIISEKSDYKVIDLNK